MKKIKLVLVFIIALFVSIINAKAALTVSRTSLTEGESFTASVGFTAAAWEVHLNSNGPVSGCYINEADSDGNALDGYRSFSATCTSTGTGTVTLTLTGNYTNEAGNTAYLNETKVVTINAKVQQQQQQPVYTPPTYYYVAKSANNNLSNLGVAGAELSTQFESGTTEYEVLMPAGTTEINVIAEKEDYRSSVSGDGVREVSDGPNSIEVIVTSESGLSKTYTLIVTVEEEAIPVRFEGVDYTFIRKAKNLPKVSSYYSVTETIYNDIKVPAYYSEITELTLIGLKDSKGIAKLYIYNPDKHSFKRYDEINLGNIAVQVKIPPKSQMISDLKQSLLKIDGNSYGAYQFDLDSDYYLVYGTNVNTNNTGWFIYDSEENTLQRYNMDEVINLTKQRDKLFIIIKLLGTLCVIAVAFMITFYKITEKKEK